MTPSGCLQSLLKASLHRFNRIKGIVQSIAVDSTTTRVRVRRKRRIVVPLCAGEQFAALAVRDVNVGFAVIELVNAWANFIRAYYLSCVYGAKTLSGQRISCNLRPVTEQVAIGVAVHHFRPKATPNSKGCWDRRIEPAWHVPNTLLKLAASLQLSNLATINAAFSLPFTVLNDAPKFRHFYAHRNPSTLENAVTLAFSYGIANMDNPTQVLLDAPIGRPQVLLLEWIDETRLLAEMLCQ